MDLAALAARAGDPWTPQNRYFAEAEHGYDDLWRFISSLLVGCDFTYVVDLAAGHGRNSVKLAELAGTLVVLDIQPGNVAICRERLKHCSTTTAHVNNGYDLRPVPDATATLVYCFDAMVHFDSDVVRSYLRDTFRALVPGGCGFFHHSNYTGGEDWAANPHSRAFMSAELFAHYARKEGLNIVWQKPHDWGGIPKLDCLTMVAR